MNPKPGDILSYLEMYQAEGVSLQRGRNFCLKPNYSIHYETSKKYSF